MITIFEGGTRGESTPQGTTGGGGNTMGWRGPGGPSSAAPHTYYIYIYMDIDR